MIYITGDTHNTTDMSNLSSKRLNIRSGFLDTGIVIGGGRTKNQSMGRCIIKDLCFNYLLNIF